MVDGVPRYTANWPRVTLENDDGRLSAMVPHVDVMIYREEKESDWLEYMYEPKSYLRGCLRWSQQSHQMLFGLA